ncbi:hypothetical protein DFQ11_101540 [Winogradskyella epiphytica]|uniref:DUF2975 family protein n=1 Tax=Winogradskyella epiphytica TaxID=262005 RepID=A0A2V4XM01_9FLAO|nr:DUF2975 domain-containing protein [Winogradskyella epiphytica]PYE83109.1 hypothetical protein DFQ11_101540 [Winogradskyella epiphytica]GGW55847.1 hypothetical protein GCM10008085_04070 [Winogradskyella epiphytica]
MRKLVVLKSVVDFIWIVTCIPAIPLLLFFTVFIFINPDALDILFDIDYSILKTPIITVQVFALLSVILAFISIYCFYLFRKTLRYFQKVKPFHDQVIQNFYKIGYLLSGVGVTASVLFVVAQLLFKGQFKIHLGITPSLMLICLGLFFMVLSEVFKVAKNAKQENDLTI